MLQGNGYLKNGFRCALIIIGFYTIILRHGATFWHMSLTYIIKSHKKKLFSNFEKSADFLTGIYKKSLWYIHFLCQPQANFVSVIKTPQPT